jgi:hypothetical protein
MFFELLIYFYDCYLKALLELFVGGCTPKKALAAQSESMVHVTKMPPFWFL